MRNIRIGTRLLLGFGVVLALTVGMGLYSLSRQSRVRRFTEDIQSRDWVVLGQLRDITEAEYRMRAARFQSMQRHLLRKSGLLDEDATLAQAEWRQAKDQNVKLLGDMTAAVSAYERESMTPRRTAQWRKIRGAIQDVSRTLQALAPEIELQFALTNRDDLKQVVARLPEAQRRRELFERSLAEARKLVEEQVDVGRGDIAEFDLQARNSIILALVATVLLAIGSSAIIQRSITRPLSGFVQFVESVGKGDLTVRAPDVGRDEVGDLARTLNGMVAGLSEVAGQTRTAAENLAAAVTEILASAQQQATSTTEQAAAVQQSTVTMTELTQAGAQISERAKSVAAGAEATTAASAAGLQAVRNTTTTMEAIREQAEAVAQNVIALSEKTQAVGEIIATVNDLAEQSHLLALNAAIEAAAAGEHGRTFSVVASEMKNLADQSKDATVQVRSILGDIQKGINSSVMLTEEAVKRVESGRQQSEVADRTIRQLTDNIQQSVQAFQQIVAGSAQQQIGFDQVVQAVRNIHVATEQTAASTRQSEKAATNLNALAQQLRGVVERYRT